MRKFSRPIVSIFLLSILLLWTFSIGFPNLRFTPQVVDAASAVKQYVPIVLTNSQPVSTTKRFQQMITFDPSEYSAYERTDLGNIRFCADSACKTQLYAWLESCTPSCSSSASSAVVWVNLGSKTVPALGSLTIYLVFYSISTRFQNSNNFWGEAPQLSSPYGAHDNGKKVFLAYYNMKTDPVTSSLHGGTDYSIVTGSGPLGNSQPLLTWTGVSGTGGQGGTGNQLASIKATKFPASFTITAWVETDQFPWDIGLGSTSSSSLYNGYSVDPGEGYNSAFAIWKVTGNLWDYPVIGILPYSMTPNTWYTLQYTYVAGGSIQGGIEAFQNTLTVLSPSATVTTSDSSYKSFDSILLAPFSGVSTYATHWALIAARSYPPGGVMPAAVPE